MLRKGNPAKPSIKWDCHKTEKKRTFFSKLRHFTVGLADTLFEALITVILLLK
jgi:hypothetical protein